MGLSAFLLSILAQAPPPPPPAPPAGGGFDVITFLFGAGGLGALAGAYQLFQTMRKGKLENEETLIARLNADSKQQSERADKAEADLVAARRAFEQELGSMRRQRDRARDKAATFRTLLVTKGFPEVPTLDDLYE